jgi:predicted acetyltransferase
LKDKEHITPGQMSLKDWEKFDEFLTRCKNYREGINVKPNRVPATLYFIINEKEKVVWGVSIRHYLNDALRFTSGHIGYGIRPSERKKWYASQSLKLSLEKCKDMDISDVLLTCDTSNIASAKVIEKNWWILDSEYEDEWIPSQRYRIHIK